MWPFEQQTMAPHLKQIWASFQNSVCTDLVWSWKKQLSLCLYLWIHQQVYCISSVSEFLKGPQSSNLQFHFVMLVAFVQPKFTAWAVFKSLKMRLITSTNWSVALIAYYVQLKSSWLNFCCFHICLLWMPFQSWIIYGRSWCQFCVTH